LAGDQSPSRAGSVSSGPIRTRSFGELLIDLEEDRMARAIVFSQLKEMERT
jgi:hypothetical protein